MKILSICTSAGLLDKAFLARGHEVVAGCEIVPHKRSLYRTWCGGEFLCHDLADLPEIVRGQHFDAVVGGPSCQSHTRLQNLAKPKFPDLTPLVNSLLDAVRCQSYLFENVVPIDIPGSCTTKLNAMNFPERWKGQAYHQSRARWFTHSDNLGAPGVVRVGTVDSLMAYSIVVGRHYGPKRAAVLQGWPEFARIKAPCVQLQEALADGVPRGLATAWAVQLEKANESPH